MTDFCHCFAGTALNVNVSLFVMSISSINEISMVSGSNMFIVSRYEKNCRTVILMVNYFVIGPAYYYDVIDNVFVAKQRGRAAWQQTQNQRRHNDQSVL